MLATTDEAERRIGAFLIGNIDDEGYLRCELDEAVAATKADHATVARVLSMIQTFDPTGIGARDLRECLLIQVRFLGLEGSLIETSSRIICRNCRSGAQHLMSVTRELTKALNLPSEEVTMALHILKTLDPSPGQQFTSEPAEAIVPDVVVMKVGR